MLLAVLLYLAHPAELVQALSQLTIVLALYLMLISVLLVYASALKWKLFIESFGKSASLWSLFHYYLVGYFVNLLAPSYVGGDIARSWYVGKKIGQHQAFTATILERYTGLAAMIGLGVVFVWFVDQANSVVRLSVVLLAVGLVIGTSLALSQRALSFLGRIRFLASLLKHLEKIQEGLRLARSNHGLLLKTISLSLLFHSITVLNTFAAAYAVGWTSVPVGDLFVVLPLILLIGALPVAPSGLGVQEGAFYFFLTGIGATPAQALGVGVILRAKSYVLALWGGLYWWLLRNRENAVQLDKAGL